MGKNVLRHKTMFTKFRHILATTALFSVVALPPHQQTPTKPLSASIADHHPYWLRVLAQGASFIPEPLKMDTSSWADDEIKARAYTALNRALLESKNIRTGQTPPTNANMNRLIDWSKRGQFLLARVREKYEFTRDFPLVTHTSDPIRARLFNELSRSILSHVIGIIDNPGFQGFEDFDISLLKSAEGYLREAIITLKNAHSIAPDRYRSAIMLNISGGYNNLGLTLNLLGDTRGAKEMYEKALEISPDDEQIKKNMDSILQNASYRRRGLL